MSTDTSIVVPAASRETPLSTDLAGHLVRLRDTGLSDRVRAETVRALVNIIGTTIGAADYEGVDIVIETAIRHGGPGRVPVPGRIERVDPFSAAVATGTAAHLDDFDDTHLATVVHPAAPVFAAVVPMIARHRVPGDRLLTAMALGMEAELRVAQAMTPWHYDAGWHITGTVGVLGAAVTCGLLLDQDEAALSRSLAIATSFPLGHREAFGTMVKPFHPGKAGADGLLAAHLAVAGGTAAPMAFEDAHGFFATLSPTVARDRVTEGIGESWELLDNTYKPFPCGIVSHPAIEAAERLHAGITGRDVVEVRVICHPLVVELTGNPEPRDGLSARFSTIHGVAAGLANGVVGLAQYELDQVRRADIAALRDRTRLIPTEGIARDGARVEVLLGDGSVERAEVIHARGSRERPMSDPELDAKVARLIESTLPGRSSEIIGLVRGVDKITDCRDLLAGLLADSDD